MADVIRCPKCGRKVHELTQFELSYLDPHFHCKCGFKGTLYWERERMAKHNQTGKRHRPRRKGVKRTIRGC